MKIGLFNVDSKMPNIALMKISSWHKKQGDSVDWYSPLFPVDRVYASSIFTYSNKSWVKSNMIRGGSGFDLTTKLPEEIEKEDCDYSLYPNYEQAIGFLTRGCNRKCEYCIVPEKEGSLKPYRNIEEITQGRNEVVLLDNNILGNLHYGLRQIVKIVNFGLKVDFNQGLDPRHINHEVAYLLAMVRWLKPIRLACDHENQIASVLKTVKLLRQYGCTPSRYFVYMLVKEIPSALKRAEVLRDNNLDPFAQPYRDTAGNEPTNEIKRFARWVNHKATFKTVPWNRYNG